MHFILSILEIYESESFWLLYVPRYFTREIFFPRGVMLNIVYNFASSFKPGRLFSKFIRVLESKGNTEMSLFPSLCSTPSDWHTHANMAICLRL